MNKRRYASGRTLALVAAAVMAALTGMLGGTLPHLQTQPVATSLTTCTWTGATNSFWSTASNWNCGTSTDNGPPGTSDLVVFPASVPSSGSTINLDESTSELAGITFENSYTLAITSTATTLNLDPSAYGVSGDVAISETTPGDTATVGAGSGSMGSITIEGNATVEAANSSNLDLNATLAGEGGSTLTVGSASAGEEGIVALGGPATYSDAMTDVLSGTLELDASSPSLPSTTSLVLGSSAILNLAGPEGSPQSPNKFTFANAISAAAGSMIAVEPDLYHAWWTFTGTLDLTGSGRVLINAGGSGGFDDDLHISGQVTGSAGIQTIGDWTTYLMNSSNDYSGGTAVKSPGTLAVSASGALGIGSVTDKGFAPIVLSDGATPTNKLYVNGASTYCGGILCAGHVTQSPSDTSNGGWAGPIILEGTTYLGAKYAGDELEISGPISSPSDDSYGIVTSGGGTILLSGDNAYTGPTEAASGTLEVTNGNALGGADGAEVTVDSSATLQLASGSANPGCLPAGTSPASFTLPNDIVLQGSSTGFEVLDNCEGTNTISGKVYLESNTVVIDVNSPNSSPCPTSSDLTLSGPVVGSEGLTLGSGAYGIYGQLTLSGQDSYTGATTVEDGILDVTGSITASSGLTLDGGNILEGTGAVPSITTNNCSSSTCTVYPGDAPGVLSSSGYANLSASGSTLQVSLPSNAPGAYSELVADGADIKGTNLSITSAAYAPYGTTYDILKNTSSTPVTGTFSYDGSPLLDGEIFQAGSEKFIINYYGGPSGYDVTLTDVTNPPPPPPAPVVSSVSPSNGPASGGTTVTITGKNFSGTAFVHFGKAEALSFTVVSSTELTAVSPPGTSGQSVDVTVTTPSGTSAASTADLFSYTSFSVTGYHPLTPTRVCDTRPGNPSGLIGAEAQCNNDGPVMPGSPINVKVTGLAGVPSSGVSAVVVNVTAVDASGPGYLTVFPAGATMPSTSNVNYGTGQTVANLVEVGVGSNGEIAIASGGSAANVLVDISGYYSVPSQAGEGLYNPVAPERICDTRSGNPSNLSGTALSQCEGKTLMPGTPLTIQVTGLGNIPSTGVSAVALHVTAVNESGSGYLTVYPAMSGAAPVVSNVNFVPSQGAVSNTVIVGVNSSGQIDIESSVMTNVVVDTEGYFTTASGTGSEFNALSQPARILDTRCAVSPAPSFCSSEDIPSANASVGMLGAGQTITVTAAGVDGIPSDATAVAVNITATNTTGNSYLTVYPPGSPSLTSVLNWTAGQTVSNLVLVTLGSSGTFDIENQSGNTNVMVDVMGYYSS
jgi:autotransporter-associated beta strand protein